MTKKAIKEAIKNAPRFIVYIDYKAGSEKGYGGEIAANWFK